MILNRKVRRAFEHITNLYLCPIKASGMKAHGEGEPWKAGRATKETH